jgi:hypothetical protein
MNAKILQKSISLKLRQLVNCCASLAKETRGAKMKDRPIMLLKTHVEEMSVLCLAIMCMKNKVVKVF